MLANAGKKHGNTRTHIHACVYTGTHMYTDTYIKYIHIHTFLVEYLQWVLEAAVVMIYIEIRISRVYRHMKSPREERSKSHLLRSSEYTKES